jgi:hypothetical protein
MNNFSLVATLAGCFGLACSAGGGVTLAGRVVGAAGADAAQGLGGSPMLSLGGAASNLDIDSGSTIAPTTCAGSATTTVSGTVYDPAGNLPLYNVIVYVPSQPLATFTEGVTCDQCAGTASGAPVAAALSDSSGKFVLKDVPAGTNIPLVIQIGKWRRQVTIPKVTACVDNPITDPNLTRLPRNQSEGHIPQIAVTTGHADALECLLRKIGIDDHEFTTSTGSGRVHMFVGCNGSGLPANQFTPALGGATFPDASTLWGDPVALMKYDLLVLSCEGSQCATAKKPYTANIKAYADAGGRLFLDHLHFYWLRNGVVPWPTTANYIGTGTDLPTPMQVNVDTSFPKGSALADWLVNVGASTTRGQITILGGQYSVQAAMPPMTQQWIYTDQNPASGSMGHGVEYMTMNTPVEQAATPANQCGRAVYTDLHVSAASPDSSHSTTPFPGGCVSADLTAQEKALIFMLFDLSSCVMSETVAPTPPPVVK